MVICAVLLLIFFATYLFSPSTERIPAGTPEVVVVTVLDEAVMSEEYRARIKENRKYYAAKHGICPNQHRKRPRLRLEFDRLFYLFPRCQRV